MSDYSGPDPYHTDSAYRVPPPPRPIPATPPKPHGAYLDMSGSIPGTPPPYQQTSTSRKKSEEQAERPY